MGPACSLRACRDASAARATRMSRHCAPGFLSYIDLIQISEFFMGHNEAGVIGDFKKTMREAALASGSHFDEFALGPQDRSTLADDLWVSYDHFAIVESKWSQDQIAAERKKLTRVSALCTALQLQPNMANLHARCHRIAWRETPSNRLITQEYRKAVCGSICPDTCAGLDCTKGALTIDAFATDFLGDPPKHCLSATEFQTYVKWLTRVVAGAESQIIVLARAKDGGCTVSNETSLQELARLLPKRPQRRVGGTPGKKI